MSEAVIEVATQAYSDQKPGTSGLRKKVKVFRDQPNYLENFVQSILRAAQPKLLVLGGDGRYYLKEAIDKIIKLCAANGVEHLIVGQNGILSTPAVSAIIRMKKADGGIILTASHNPGGEDGDFGIKYNTNQGGPAPESMTDKIYEISKSITSYNNLIKKPQIDLTECKTFKVHNMEVEVEDSVYLFAALMEFIFDHPKITRFIAGEFDKFLEKPFKMLLDTMNGVMGPYCKEIFVDELRAPEECLINATPLPDFGGKHPDPNLTYASELVERMKADPSIQFGVAFDGDGDRNMILGQNAFFVSPGDSLAIIADNMRFIKHFHMKPAEGFARSFPTSPAIDRVAKKYRLKCYETPTGWKYFANLFDYDKISLCGEESFGTGAGHIREKDGMWACLAWLSILSGTKKSVKKVCLDHWAEFGRDYFCRYDFEECDSTKCTAMINELETLFGGTSLIGKSYGDKQQYVVKETGNFEYTDPIDGTVASKQGLYVKFENEARIVVRLSGTGSSGATVRLYVSDYSKDNVTEDSQVFLAELLRVAYEITKLPEKIGRDTPTVIT